MRNDRGYLRVGVTGGIGAGKSEVCALFAGRGRVVLSADRVAREMMESDPAIVSGVRRLFGAEAYHPDGTLNREFVAHAIFGDPRQRKQLDAMVHPPVINSLLHTLDTLPPEQRAPYTIVEAALLYESGMHRSLDAVIVVHASEALRVERLLKREGSSRAEILKRFRAQLPAGEKRELGDFVILNEGSLASLREKVVFFDMLLTRMAG
ncbi:MAG: dephospho-CoA kinase [Bacteroidetes bacterium]|nr:dephospho-CoA kinase [Bacteroidota bacterium]